VSATRSRRTGTAGSSWGPVKTALARLPGALEAALTIKHALRPPPRGAFPGRAFHSWLRDLPGSLPPPDRRILLFACRDNWLRFSLATAVVLLARRCRVDFAYLPYTRVDREESLLDAKEFRFYYGRFLDDRCHPYLRFLDLTGFAASPASPEMAAEADRQSLLDTRWLLQREELDLDGNRAHREAYEFRRRRNLDCMSRVVSLLERHPCDGMLLAHGNLRELGAAFRAARLLGRRAVTFDFKERAEALVLSGDGPVCHMDTSREWAADAPHTLGPEGRERVGDLMARRLEAKWKGFSWSHQYTGFTGDRDAVLGRLHLPGGGPMVLLCPNVAWDSSLQGRDRAFPSLAEWIRHTVRFFAARPDTRLVVRAHPSETMFGTAQPVAGMVRECFPQLPANLRIVDSQELINTYDLMDLCDLGLVYNSTTGLEFALRGLPVVVAGRPHYGEKGFTIDVDTRDQYDAAMEGLLAAPGSRLSDRQVELAWCYADVFFFRWHHPFPWCMATFWQDMERWPLRRVLSEEGERRFGPTLDLLVGRPYSN